MSTLSLRLPDSLHRRIRELAQQEGISINQFVSTAVAEKMAALLTVPRAAGTTGGFQEKRCPPLPEATCRLEAGAPSKPGQSFVFENVDILKNCN